MYLKKFKPINNSNRFKKKISSFNTNEKKFKRLSTGFSSFSGRNNQSKICVRNRKIGNKKSFFKLDYFRKFNNILGICINLKKISLLNSFISLIKYSNGVYSYTLASNGFKQGFYLFSTTNPTKFSFKYILNCNIFIKYLSYNVIFYNVELKYYCGGKYSRSAGSFCKIINIDLTKNISKILLPTGKKKKISIYCLVSLGRSSNIYFNKQFFSKAGYNNNKGFKSNVRGVAMNPVDHPHGGRTKTNSPELTPWGKIAKKNK